MRPHRRRRRRSKQFCAKLSKPRAFPSEESLNSMNFDILERRASARPELSQNKRWHGIDRPSWRSFAIALVALGAALFLALYSGAAADGGHLLVAGISALVALALAGWVALTIVPVLARRTPLRGLTYQIGYKVTREGLVYLGGVFVVALAALNTGNNLLFMILACLLAGMLISGLLSRLVLSGVDVRLALPQHIFAGRPVMAIAELHNTKQTIPSFSVWLVGEEKQKTKKDVPTKAAPNILARPVYFPYVPHQQTVRQSVDLTFPRRGIYRQDGVRVGTKIPLCFFQKTRRLDSEIEALVYPSVEPT